VIGRLSGVIELAEEDFVIIDVGGVGFKVFCSAKTLDTLPKARERVTLLIETVVREDSITLFGFPSQEEQVCFNTLCRVNGISNKLAIKIMDVLSVRDIVLAIANSDQDTLCRASGVGKKMALRIIAELQSCSMVKNFEYFGLANLSGKVADSGEATGSLVGDAIRALEGLGYHKNSIYSIVACVAREKPDLGLEGVITESLRKIGNL
jgi:Holliday junction DNA helicase RuvA